MFLKHKHSSIGIGIATILTCLISAIPAQAQQELMLHALPDVWHSTSTNPAFFPGDKKLAIGLPGLGLDAAHSGDITYKDVFVKKGDLTVLDFSNALSKLDPSNTLHFDQRTETVSLGLRLPGKFWLQAGHANRLSGAITYPKTLPSLIWDGNAQYVGQTVDIAFNSTVSDWNEWSVGLAKELGKLKVGGRIKLLTGNSAFRSDNAHQKATISTSNDIYQLTLATDYGFHASSIISSIDTAGLGYDFVIGSLKDKTFTSNRGFAFDLGAQYQVNDKIMVDFALLDLGGKIKWTEKSNYFLSQGEFQYDGVSLPGAAIINGTDSLDFSTKLDTLNDIFKFQKTAQDFETTLPLRAYLGGNYKLTERLSFGLGAYLQKRADEKASVAVGFNARYQVFKFISLGAMYSVNARSAANVGFHLIVKPGPVQLYFASDNILNAFTLTGKPAVNLRAGLSLIF